MNRSPLLATTIRRLLGITGAAAVAVTAVLAPVGAAQAATGPGQPDHVPPGLEQKAADEGMVPVIVRLDVATSSTYVTNGSEQASIVHARKELMDALGHRPAALKTSKTMPLVAFHATPEDLEILDSSPEVGSVMADEEMTADATSWNGSDAGQQLTSQWDYTRIRANVAKRNGYTGAGQVIAILDTGVDRFNPYLTNKVVAEACYSTVSPLVSRTAGNCPNGTSVQTGAGAAKPCTYSYTCSHGTHVAHTAAGQYGVASGAKIIAINVFHRGYDANGNPTPLTWNSDLTWAMNYVYSLRNTYRIAAVNLSLGGGAYAGYCDGIATDGTDSAGLVGQWFTSLRNAGIAPVVSSGNAGSPTKLGSPGCFSSAISVGNTTLTGAGADAVYAGSNSNATLDLLAPGTDICSAVPIGLDNDGRADGWQCGWTGTSMAAPQVAGTIAVLRGYWNGASVNQVEKAMKTSGLSVYDTRNGITRSRIDVWGAINRLYSIAYGG